ncbi:hypothetical protein [Nostoc cycadae]|nr:hypothetical protein [Nostoc cycadae]
MLLSPRTLSTNYIAYILVCDRHILPVAKIEPEQIVLVSDQCEDIKYFI